MLPIPQGAMDKNYSPPVAGFDDINQGPSIGSKEWFRARPFPVYLICISGIFQIAVLCYATYHGWAAIIDMLATGVMSMAEFFGGYLFPALYFLASVLLFFLRKSAAFAFSLYWVWGLGKYLSGSSRGAPTIYDLIWTTCIVAYCWMLYRQKRLK